MPQTILVEQTVKRISPYPKRVQRRCKLQTMTDDRDDPHEARTGSADPELVTKPNGTIELQQRVDAARASRND